MCKRTLLVFTSVVLLLPAPAMSQNSASADDAGTDLKHSADSTPARSKPYEIVITPTVTRTDLRELIQTVEDDFFARFNELNIDKHYDIVCYKHTPTMTHITERVCEPLFLIRARADNASETAFGIIGSSRSQDVTNQSKMGTALSNPDAVRRDKRKEFEILQEKMEELNRTDSELRSIGSVLAQLKSRLENFGKDD